MKFEQRIDKLEKKAQVKAKPAAIKVNHLSSKEFESSYALHQARLKLGLVQLEEPKRIFAGVEGFEAKYENLTTVQAQKIVKENSSD